MYLVVDDWIDQQTAILLDSEQWSKTGLHITAILLDSEQWSKTGFPPVIRPDHGTEVDSVLLGLDNSLDGHIMVS